MGGGVVATPSPAHTCFWGLRDPPECGCAVGLNVGPSWASEKMFGSWKGGVGEESIVWRGVVSRETHRMVSAKIGRPGAQSGRLGGPKLTLIDPPISPKWTVLTPLC